MSVIALRVASVVDHPDADSLRIYRFEGPGVEPVQVIANDERAFAVGEVVAVALAGTTLLDGVRIKRTRLRGIDSYGLAMEPVDVEPGTDLSEGRCQVEATLDHARLVKWTSIELLHDVRKTVAERAAERGNAPPRVRYRAKVKLHGTNGGVQVLPDGRVAAQARSEVLHGARDNMGFRAWVARRKQLFAALARPEGLVVLFGEWCGDGIQKGVSISNIGRRIFAIFAAQIGDHEVEAAHLITDPDALRALVPEHDELVVLPWYGEPLEIDFAEPAAAVATLNAWVERVESEDPFVLDVFGVSGAGEGLVLYPQLETDERDALCELLFKAKGERHRVRKARQAVEADPEAISSIEAFVDTFCTPARFEQGLAETPGGGLDRRAIGPFLAWVGQDVRKEGRAALEAAGLDWKQVSRAVSDAARRWLMARIEAG